MVCYKYFCMESKELIIDTSSILFGLKYNKNIFDVLLENDDYSHLKLLISKGVVRELKKFSNSSKKLKLQANIALNTIKNKNRNITVVDSNTYVDSWILSESSSGKYIICTNDIKLRKKLKSMGVAVISITNSGKLR